MTDSHIQSTAVQPAPTEVPERLELGSHDIVSEKHAEIFRLFPEVRTEGGKIDFDRLKRVLGETVDPGRERYVMSWPGKADCFKSIQSASIGTLLPCREESLHFNESRNLLIEGDSLEVLKLLQKSYLGKIKMIYIDPPYNTGKDFIYPDNYSESLQTYLAFTGQVDSEGKRFSTNTELDGRFHSKWLNMMYPRLYLARNLLRDDGVMFVSIDDHEQDNLKKVMREVFGEENFCATFVWNTEGNTDNQYAVKVNHEYIVAYYKNAGFANDAIGRVIDPNTRDDSNLWKGIADNNVNKNNPENPAEIVELPEGFPSSEEELFYARKEVDEEFFKVTRHEKFISDEIKEKYGIEKLSGLPVKVDDMVVKNNRLVQPCRIYGGMANRAKLLEFIKGGCAPIQDDEGLPLRFYINANAAVRYQKTNEKPRNVLSVLRNVGTTERTRGYLKKIGIDYDYPKPLALIEYLIKLGCEPSDGIVLDFFAGSGTTGEAVANVNNADPQGRRQFICVQLPEPCDDGRFLNLTDLCRIRLERTLKPLDTTQSDSLPLDGGRKDFGFKMFRLAESNLKGWSGDASDPDSLSKQLELHVQNIREGRSSEDLLFEILIKSGFEPSTRLEELTLCGKHVYSIAGGAMLVCLERQLTIEIIRALAERKPERVILLDEGFAGNDQLKTNAVQTMKSKGVTSFRTV
jgi:adenine-specific DNA-methyltransferase